MAQVYRSVFFTVCSVAAAFVNAASTVVMVMFWAPRQRLGPINLPRFCKGQQLNAMAAAFPFLRPKRRFGDKAEKNGFTMEEGHDKEVQSEADTSYNQHYSWVFNTCCSSYSC